MSVCKRLREYLDACGSKYIVISHSPAFTAQEIAASMHVPGREMAKTVVIKTPQGIAMCVVRAMDKIDVDLAATELGTTSARLATEQEFRNHFPDCERGAMPPFGILYAVPTLVDAELARDREIVFNAGTHVEAVRMRFDDFRLLAKPRVGHLTLQPVGALT
jgi:Ala-tRNA(Pro) deacylase